MLVALKEVCAGLSMPYDFAMSNVQEISSAIARLDLREQIRLLYELSSHLKIQPDDLAWLKAAEPLFEFWDNSEDAVYDQL